MPIKTNKSYIITQQIAHECYSSVPRERFAKGFRFVSQNYFDIKPFMRVKICKNPPSHPVGHFFEVVSYSDGIPLTLADGIAGFIFWTSYDWIFGDDTEENKIRIANINLLKGAAEDTQRVIKSLCNSITR